MTAQIDQNPPKVRISNIEMVPIIQLVPHPKNPNKHTKDQVNRLAEIIEWQGWRYPVKVSNQSGFVTSGHGRIEAAKLRGWSEVPVSRQDYESEAQEYADVVSDNAIAEWASLDLGSINKDIIDLGPDFNIDLLGIEDFTLTPEEKLPPGDENHVPSVRTETICKPGDVWQLGSHRLVCGDSTTPQSWDHIHVKVPTMVFTSPPYGLGEGAKLREKKYVKGAPKLKTLYNEHADDPDNWLNLMRDWTSLAIGYAQSTVCNVQMLAKNKRDLIAWMSEFGTHLADIAIWDKGHGPPQMQANVLTNAFEFLFILSSEPNASRTIPFGDFHADQTNVVRVGKSKNNDYADVHKATMPIELVDWALTVVGKTAEHIIDPFGGTGTTLIAAEKAKKTCGLIELDPKYCDVIIARWQKYTGQTAELIVSDGQP